jgi:hypothetical protein
LFIWLVVVTFREGKRSDARKQLEKDFEVEVGELLIWSLVLAKLHLLESTLEIRESAKASYSLEAGQWGLLDSVGVVKCFDCIGVGTSSHQQVSGMDMDHRVLLVRDDQLLEIVESKVVVAKQIGAFASEYVSFVERLVEFESNREVLHGFIEDAQTSISPSSGEMELTGGLFLFCNRHVEVIQRIIKLVHLIIQQSSEEIQTRLLLFFAAAIDCHVQEFHSLFNFLQFLR